MYHIRVQTPWNRRIVHERQLHQYSNYPSYTSIVKNYRVRPFHFGDLVLGLLFTSKLLFFFLLTQLSKIIEKSMLHSSYFCLLTQLSKILHAEVLSLWNYTFFVRCHVNLTNKEKYQVWLLFDPLQKILTIFLMSIEVTFPSCTNIYLRCDNPSFCYLFYFCYFFILFT